MTEYFINARSFAAPFVSDTDTSYESAESPQAALNAYAARYNHPAGLYAAEAYDSADAYHKRVKPLAQWLCNHEQARQRLTTAIGGAYSYLGNAPGDFEINGERHVIADPKGGSVVVRAR